MAGLDVTQSHRTLAYAIGSSIQKFKKIKGPRTTIPKYCLINLDHIKEDQKANFGSTRTIASYPCGLGMRLLIQFLSVSTDTIFQGPKVTHGMEHTSGNTRPH